MHRTRVTQLLKSAFWRKIICWYNGCGTLYVLKDWIPFLLKVSFSAINTVRNDTNFTAGNQCDNLSRVSEFSLSEASPAVKHSQRLSATKSEPLTALRIPNASSPGCVTAPMSSPIRTEPLPDVLAMPQLVAVLFLRNNDKRSTRTRTQAALKRQATQGARPGHVTIHSPLRKCIVNHCSS